MKKIFIIVDISNNTYFYRDYVENIDGFCKCVENATQFENYGSAKKSFDSRIFENRYVEIKKIYKFH